MRVLTIALALGLVAFPAAAETSDTPAAQAAPLSVELSIAAIAADPAGKAVLEKEMPNLLKHPSYESFKGMTLRQLQPYSSGAITDEEIARVDASLKAATSAD